MKNNLAILLLLSLSLVACNEEQKSTVNTEQPKVEQAQPHIQKQDKIEAVTSEQEFAKTEKQQTPADLTTENKTPNYYQKVEEAKKATLNAANKLADVMESKVEQVTKQLSDKINQIDVAKATEKLTDKINEIDIDKVTKPLKKQMDKFNQFLDKLDTNKKPEQKKKTKIEEGYL
ncbi:MULTISPECIES: hypothetical protein [Pasteurellaceae]|uniref:Lipoprotein n=1 Tax=Pasteurella atlantica TaxID=2827233 RepID=A0AAW8CI83_9PAST|nr:hypothetical protein [Pasteurella atlantica]MBR0572716.1 hypothetical protein [Pasteurella atlantica]MDP8038661.1 hypothetical protein [Pasteurella atlantica]MDP8040753.1 hypothetical protein [Pasteurella atlantica]MDP8042888.1 hypothetical protein [Pasteurella atlantica]MDP8044975.1 hypothetical protein [Pasteurella atlantica]